MKCPQCTLEMGKTSGRYQYRECGLDNIWLLDCEIFVCPECNTRLPILPDPLQSDQMIIRQLVCEKGRLDGDSIVFLRKAMGFKATELAQVLGVDRVTVSRWENDRVTIDPYLDFKLRMEAIDRVLLKHERREIREEVTSMLQRSYKPEIPMGDLRINLVANQELQSVFDRLVAAPNA